jgi:acetylornithine deacetylase/succinyl-diaminopimelate desuccinylase-like protein
MTRLTISPNVIRGGVKTNVVPDLCEVEADIRVLPDQDQPYVLAELRKCLGEGIEVEISTYRPPSFSQTSSPYYQLIERTIREVTTTPERTTVCLPMISPGATDSRFLRAAGFPCYGVAVFSPQFPQELRATLHGPDERLDIESLHYFTEFLIRLARNYLG